MRCSLCSGSERSDVGGDWSWNWNRKQSLKAALDCSGFGILEDSWLRRINASRLRPDHAPGLECPGTVSRAAAPIRDLGRRQCICRWTTRVVCSTPTKRLYMYSSTQTSRACIDIGSSDWAPLEARLYSNCEPYLTATYKGCTLQFDRRHRSFSIWGFHGTKRLPILI
jgi:hypothetical protein